MTHHLAPRFVPQVGRLSSVVHRWLDNSVAACDYQWLLLWLMITVAVAKWSRCMLEYGHGMRMNGSVCHSSMIHNAFRSSRLVLEWSSIPAAALAVNECKVIPLSCTCLQKCTLVGASSSRVQTQISSPHWITIGIWDMGRAVDVLFVLIHDVGMVIRKSNLAWEYTTGSFTLHLQVKTYQWSQGDSKMASSDNTAVEPGASLVLMTFCNGSLHSNNFVISLHQRQETI